MADPRVSTQPTRIPTRVQAGIISRIRLENFMCHSNLEIELGDSVNFITGQNGSGKSAILTALCVAFGSRARGTQRANTMKDFIKTGCSHALVQVDVKNQGEDAFKPDIYGDVIVVERRISESTSSISLKNSQGKRLGTKKDDLREVIVHFNDMGKIDVENPCVVMSQDKSREFLHSGNAKDKFKFFFKATLLQRVDDLLRGIEKQLNDATAMLNHLEGSLRPILKELDELQENIRSMEQVEEISLQVQLLRKKLAWAWVYDAEKKFDQKHKLIEKLKGRIPSCQEQINLHHDRMKDLSDQFANKKSHVSNLLERTNEVKTKRHELEESVSMAVKERLELEGEQDRKTRQLQKIVQKVQLLEQQIHDIHEQYNRNTQAEHNEMEERLMALQGEVDKANAEVQRLKEEEETMTQRMSMIEKELEEIARKVQDAEGSHRDISSRIRELQMHQTNKVTAFGGHVVSNLLRAIERYQQKFSIPPIGPIGAHVKLVHGDMWSIAVENAVGQLLNAFIVTDHKDSLALRACAREANYNHLKIIIYDFSRPRMDIPRHMLPQTKHPTTFNVIHSDNPTVLNVLIDLGNAERQVLVKDYDVGKTVAFDQRISNLKEVYTSDGYKMFSRGSAQTILPPYRNLRAGRLCASFDNQIKDLQRDAEEAKVHLEQGRGVKRIKEEELKNLQDSLRSIKKRRMNVDRHLRSKDFELQDLKNSLSSEAGSASESTVDELHQEISKLQDEIREKETFLEELQMRVDEAGNRAKDLKASLEKFRESARKEVDAFDEAEKELLMLEKDLRDAEAKKKHYEGVMDSKVLPDLKKAEAEYQELENLCKESHKKASIICPQSEIEALGCKESNPEQLSADLTKLKERFQRESQRFSESIEDLKMLREKKQLKISRKQQTYKALREKLEVCDKALQLRWGKYQKTALGLARQLTWQFSGHLRKKGIQGNIKVNYEEQTLSIEVTMPQDASSSTVKDTRGLSGGERSFSTLCFALTLHEMTESPFRAMDEFDVFMDAVSRKISLDAIVDFALAQGSQWIFITPHDISMVKNDERIKKQQMAAPRG